MSNDFKSLFSIDSLNQQQVHQIFSLSSQFKANKNKASLAGKVALFLFLEPSTRTRVSFQIASSRLGVENILVDGGATFSTAKGESSLETLETLVAMEPDLLVVRAGDDPELISRLQDLNLPVISAGVGVSEHPTQALLDGFTLYEKYGQLEGLKVLISGDLSHSRVANSNIRLLKMFGAEVSIACPQEFLPQGDVWQGVQHFTELEEGVEWCDVLMGLRIQKERHSSQDVAESSQRDFLIDGSKVQKLKESGSIMHPGPFVPGIDFATEVLSDKRCLVREQVKNGVYVRMALLALALGWEG